MSSQNRASKTARGRVCTRKTNRGQYYVKPCERRGGLMVRVLDSGSSGPCSGPGWGHCVVFLGKTLYSRGASLHLGV